MSSSSRTLPEAGQNDRHQPSLVLGFLFAQIMKPWKDVPIPARLARRPRDRRGYPIPASVLVDADGVPDFRVTDHEKWFQLVRLKCCALCGEQLGRHLAFIGGPLSHQNRLFTDLPMHKECASYAVQVCPYIAAPNFRYAETLTEKEGLIQAVSAAVHTDRPERFFLGTTKACRPAQLPDGTLVVQASPWESTEWWVHGELQPPAPHQT